MKHLLLAKQYIGKLEKAGNSGFEDSKFEADMIKFGAWQSGFAWCACFVRMIMIKSYPEKASIYKTILFPGTRQTFESLKAKGYTISQKPIVGSLALWANYVSGRDTGKGHAAFVTEVLEDGKFKTIEGNGSDNGSRNGDRVVEHVRGLEVKPNGLNILGFIEI
jgi:hypothetical protein